jgi:mannose-6-phosphate isomerase-like protein (cupin superfamily)
MRSGMISKVKMVAKTWGKEEWFANNSFHNYCGKVLTILDGHSTSMHYHANKHETFYVLEGTLQVDWIETEEGIVNTTIIGTGGCMEMPSSRPHKLIAKNGNVKLIEASTYHRDSDSHRVYR